MKKLILILLLFCRYCYPYPASDVSVLTDSEYSGAVKQLIKEAKKSIYISMYIMSYLPGYNNSPASELLNELSEAHKRGVYIKVILDQQKVYSASVPYNDLAYFFLRDAGICVDYDLPTKKLHNKLIVIDENIVIIGSHNWSKYALQENNEVSVVIKSPGLSSECIELINSIPVSPRRDTPSPFTAKDICIPYQFLTNPTAGSCLVKSHAYDSFDLYIYLLTKWQNKTFFMDYYEAAVYLGMEDRSGYRRDINRLLLDLRRKYNLINMILKRNERASITLLDYKDKNKVLFVEPSNSFIVPGSFWEFGWYRRLSLFAKYFYFINLVETSISDDPKGRWSLSQTHLNKKYHVSHGALSSGSVELNRYNILDVDYGPRIYPIKKHLRKARYKLKPLYSWEWYQKELAVLKKIYGEREVDIAIKRAEVLLEENNLYIIEKLINYAEKYGNAVVQYAIDIVARRQVGNRTRSFVYIEAIILNYVKKHKKNPDIAFLDSIPDLGM